MEVSKISYLPFSKAVCKRALKKGIHFYERDKNFERIRKNPEYWIKFVSQFSQIIAPDFSLYWSMDLETQKQNKNFNLGFANEVAKLNKNVVYNVRYGDSRSYDFCFEGFPKNATLALGSHGCIKHYEERIVFAAGFYEMIKRLTPQTIIIYGYANLPAIKYFENCGGRVIRIPSAFEMTHKK